MSEALVYWLQQALNALQLGGIYALIALGYTMVYGILTMINFAHGDVFMIGGFFCFLLSTQLGLSFAPTLLLTMLGTALLGVIIERLAYKPLRQAPRVSAIITALGVGLFLENFTLALSPYPKHIPMLLGNVTWNLYGLSISSIQLVIISLSLILIGLLDYIVHRTPIGMAMRAISWDKTYVPLMGIPVDWVVSITFAIGAGLAGAAGSMYALAYPVIDPYMGILVGWKAFICAVVGGIGNIRGAMVGAFILGSVEIMVVAFLPSTYRDFVAFTLLMLLIIVRPYGILGKPRVQKV
ncbi:MAG: branched-chain amino acid ABC transporter permease [Methylomicrobium sp.]